MSWLHYLIEANIYLGVFYLCYCLFLNRDTHYMLGRIYLIFSCIIAFVLPLTQLSILKPVIPEIEIVEPVKHTGHIIASIQPIKLTAPVKHFTFDDAMIYLYIAGTLIAFFVLLFRLRKLYILTRNKHSIYKDQYKLINLHDENTAFSFFNYLFIGSNVPQAETIIAHELVHIRQKHSIDIIFLEAMKIVNWFNPFIYLVQRSLKTIHEYIADEQTAAHGQDTLAYSSFLLNNAYGIQGSSIAHSFFNYNLLKKRIIMLNKNRSGKLARLKYLAALPLCAGMLCASTLVFSKDYGFIDLAPRKAVAAKPDHIKYFKIKDKDITAYSDNLSFMENGVRKMYKAATATDADLAYIMKVRKLKVEVIEVDSKTKLPLMPVVFTQDAQTDTGKKRLPPPPPAPPKKVKDQVKLPPPPPKMVKDQVKLPPPPTVDKPMEVRIDKPMTIKPDKPLKLSKDVKGKPMEVRIDKPMAVKIDKPMVVKLDKQAKVVEMPPPPPAPTDPVYDDLLKQIARTTRYPTVAYNNKVNGHVVLSLVINTDHKITNVKVEKGFDPACDAEAARALRAYSGAVNKAPGAYKIVVTFMLASEDSKIFYSPKPLGEDILNAHNFIGEVVVSGSIN